MTVFLHAQILQQEGRSSSGARQKVFEAEILDYLEEGDDGTGGLSEKEIGYWRVRPGADGKSTILDHLAGHPA
jgi:hypothetical protein